MLLKFEQNKQKEIEHAKLHLKDLIPYNSPNYEEELQKLAEFYVENQIML